MLFKPYLYAVVIDTGSLAKHTQPCESVLPNLADAGYKFNVKT